MSNDLSVKLEILRMAREIVNNEFIDKRAQDHNRWLAESEKLATRGMRIPYPDIPPYPNESIVIAKAKSLLEFVGIQNSDDAQSKIEHHIEVKSKPEPPQKEEVRVQKEEVHVEKQSEQALAGAVPTGPAPTPEDTFRDYIHKRVSDDSDRESSSSSAMVSMLLKQLEDLKKMRK